MLTVPVQSIIIPNLLQVSLMKVSSSLLTEISPPFFGSPMGPFLWFLWPEGQDSLSFSFRQFCMNALGVKQWEKKGGTGEFPCSLQLKGTPFPHLLARKDGFLSEYFLPVYAAQCPDLAQPWGKGEKTNKQKTRSHCLCLSSGFDFLPQSNLFGSCTGNQSAFPEANPLAALHCTGAHIVYFWLICHAQVLFASINGL